MSTYCGYKITDWVLLALLYLVPVVILAIVFKLPGMLENWLYLNACVGVGICAGLAIYILAATTVREAVFAGLWFSAFLATACYLGLNGVL
ncbi:hypothetical protein H8F21_13885 [Pseudomonas sp. P66]|uniref:Uncharacterized protein n=1 Tax=Pseudomonas arcuscaelestis TaxID=2710591 RepID=A0ABS2BYE7_9PSED|nr:hypothetical protein [Pseudomonas arcuscaelestis]MBM5458656.1 hypothetical protein [Pseudomonas arcuscaelestis]